MVHTNKRSGLGEAVALNRSVSKASPEFFGVTVEGGSAGDKGPEFPSELTMDAAEDPPATKKVFAFGGSKFLLKLLAATFVFEIPLNFLFKGLQHARHRDQYRNALAANRSHDVGGFECVLKYHGASN